MSVGTGIIKSVKTEVAHVKGSTPYDGFSHFLQGTGVDNITTTPSTPIQTVAVETYTKPPDYVTKPTLSDIVIYPQHRVEAREALEEIRKHLFLNNKLFAKLFPNHWFNEGLPIGNMYRDLADRAINFIPDFRNALDEASIQFNNNVGNNGKSFLATIISGGRYIVEGSNRVGVSRSFRHVEISNGNSGVPFEGPGKYWLKLLSNYGSTAYLGKSLENGLGISAEKGFVSIPLKVSKVDSQGKPSTDRLMAVIRIKSINGQPVDVNDLLKSNPSRSLFEIVKDSSILFMDSFTLQSVASNHIQDEWPILFNNNQGIVSSCPVYLSEGNPNY